MAWQRSTAQMSNFRVPLASCVLEDSQKPEQRVAGKKLLLSPRRVPQNKRACRAATYPQPTPFPRSLFGAHHYRGGRGDLKCWTKTRTFSKVTEENIRESKKPKGREGGGATAGRQATARLLGPQHPPARARARRQHAPRTMSGALKEVVTKAARLPRIKRQAMELTEAAASRIKEILVKREKPYLKIGV